VSAPFTHRTDAVVKLRHRPNLRREIVLVLAGKLLALLVIWYVWFAHPLSPDLDAGRVGAALYSSHPVVQDRTEPNAKP
jgi:hypothetical protein